MRTESLAEDIGKYWMELEKTGTVAIKPIIASLSDQFASINVDFLARQIQRTPTEAHMYPGTKETLSTLLEHGDRIVVWTQGDPHLQAWKIATSGLSSLRKGENTHNRTNFIFYAAEDKIPVIPDIISRYSPVESNDQSSFRKAIIVDDKAHNIYAAQTIVRQAREAGILPDESTLPISFVWMRHELGRSKDVLPDGVTMNTFLTICNVANSPSDLLSFRAELAEKQSLLWLLDVDHTILHTSGWRDNHFQTIANAINNTHI